MGDQLISSVVTVATAIIGVAIIAVLVSQKANTSNVINAAGNAFSGALNAATNPFSGGGTSLSIPGLGYGGTQSPIYQ